MFRTIVMADVKMSLLLFHTIGRKAKILLIRHTVSFFLSKFATILNNEK